MIKEILLPDLGEGIEGAEVSEVSVSVGKNVVKDDIILVLESDKASMEIPTDFSGEVLDVTGHLGGHNFQWAWSSGFLAGQNV